MFLTDIDECQSGKQNCHKTAGVCSNTVGSFVCTCTVGYAGNGVTCSLVHCPNLGDITQGSKSSSNTAYKTVISFSCNAGYELSHTNNLICQSNGQWSLATPSCTDIDECKTGANNCAQKGAKCLNSKGGYTCKCANGYRMTNGVCRNINECAENSATCSSIATCSDSDGSYTCKCNAGYSGDGRTCTDVDECRKQGLTRCDVNEKCVNTAGSFKCVCTRGDGIGCRSKFVLSRKVLFFVVLEIGFVCFSNDLR